VIDAWVTVTDSRPLCSKSCTNITDVLPGWVLNSSCIDYACRSCAHTRACTYICCHSCPSINAIGPASLMWQLVHVSSYYISHTILYYPRTRACILMWQQNEQSSPALHLSPWHSETHWQKTNQLSLSCIPAHVQSAHTGLSSGQDPVSCTHCHHPHTCPHCLTKALLLFFQMHAHVHQISPALFPFATTTPSHDDTVTSHVASLTGC
jgi:hypothetical protein